MAQGSLNVCACCVGECCSFSKGVYSARFQCLHCRWHIEGDINHDWKKLAQRKEKQLRKLSDTYKGQLDKV